MDLDITLWGAFAAGILSFVSPCVLPLVPPYLCYLAGVSLDELTGAEGQGDARARVFAAALAFVLGFTAVFVALGASASAIGQLVLQHITVLGYVAGAIIIVMGLHFLGVFRVSLFNREARLHVERKPAGLAGAFFIGVAFAFGWTPCIGPVLATILAVAGTTQTVGSGAFLLAIYSLGMGVPFLLAALFAGPFMRFMGRFRQHMGTVEKAMGALLVATGFLFITGQMTTMAFWLLETFPALGNIG